MISQGLEYFEGLKRMSMKTVTNLTWPTIFQQKKTHIHTQNHDNYPILINTEIFESVHLSILTC